MTGSLIPFGYGMPNAAERLATLMADPRAVLVDIRYSARSPRPEWNPRALESVYGKRYRPLKVLGNVNYNTSEPIKLLDSETGIGLLRLWLEKGYTLVLMCACVSYEKCHRKLVVDLVKAQMPEVEVVGVLYEVYQHKQEATKERPTFGDSTWISQSRKRG